MGSKTLSLKDAAAMCAQEFTVQYSDGSEEKIWLRTPTNIEIHEADDAINKAQLELKERYKIGSLKYQAMTASLDMLTPLELAQHIAAYESIDREAICRKKVARPMVPDWSRYTTETALEKAREDHDTRMSEWQSKVNTLYDEETAKRIEQLAAQPIDELVALASKPLIRQQINAEIAEITEAYAMMASIRRADDHSQPYFDDIEEIRSMPEPVKNVLRLAYKQLGDIQPVQIKNGQGESVWPSGLAENTLELTEAHSTADSLASPSPNRNSRGGRKR